MLTRRIGWVGPGGCRVEYGCTSGEVAVPLRRYRNGLDPALTLHEPESFKIPEEECGILADWGAECGTKLIEPKLRQVPGIIEPELCT